ncbi:MAG: hypothetical protein RL375_935 [Pseudomonadota bacterium]|jgi:hypothetical protein
MNQEANRPPFKVSGAATIKHLNVRKEGPEDEKILAVDIKLEVKAVDRRLCAFFDDGLETFLWRGDALIVRNEYLGPVKYLNSVSNAVAIIGPCNFHGSDVGKFAIEPKDGGVINLTLSVTAYPNSDEVAQLSKLVQEDTQVSIEGQPDLFSSMAGDAAIAAPATLSGEDDPMLDQAEAVVVQHQRASISLVQRHLRVGYNRAARLLEALEAKGIVSPMTADGNRKVLEGGAA